MQLTFLDNLLSKGTSWRMKEKEKRVTTQQKIINMQAHMSEPIFYKFLAEDATIALHCDLLVHKLLLKAWEGRHVNEVEPIPPKRVELFNSNTLDITTLNGNMIWNSDPLYINYWNRQYATEKMGIEGRKCKWECMKKNCISVHPDEKNCMELWLDKMMDLLVEVVPDLRMIEDERRAIDLDIKMQLHSWEVIVNEKRKVNLCRID
jgi:hypothetical protein